MTPAQMRELARRMRIRGGCPPRLDMTPDQYGLSSVMGVWADFLDEEATEQELQAQERQAQVRPVERVFRIGADREADRKARAGADGFRRRFQISIARNSALNEVAVERMWAQSGRVKNRDTLEQATEDVLADAIDLLTTIREMQHHGGRVLYVSANGITEQLAELD